ncbi:hypothetical protein B0T16DRAFT_403486 [Cercophora newfieldiana]|uniref:Uncharacterized protein n=1 Tax=Cercophora newfieldiana TaxID=92897 RepID=A0AA39YGW9_9PEZI|nr:hypothetical protein B0T16DRAFT_403486 [Cercophora newfieldiana]
MLCNLRSCESPFLACSSGKSQARWNWPLFWAFRGEKTDRPLRSHPMSLRRGRL